MWLIHAFCVLVFFFEVYVFLNIGFGDLYRIKLDPSLKMQSNMVNNLTISHVLPMSDFFKGIIFLLLFSCLFQISWHCRVFFQLLQTYNSMNWIWMEIQKWTILPTSLLIFDKYLKTKSKNNPNICWKYIDSVSDDW